MCGGVQCVGFIHDTLLIGVGAACLHVRAWMSPDLHQSLEPGLNYIQVDQV